MNVLARVVLDLPDFVKTVTATFPGMLCGTVAVTFFELTTLTPMARWPPTVTFLTFVKFLPRIVIFVPPVTTPRAGVTLVTAGFACGFGFAARASEERACAVCSAAEAGESVASAVPTRASESRQPIAARARAPLRTWWDWV
nr:MULTISPECIES: hypothetical protein [unclassified Nocardioides]